MLGSGWEGRGGRGEGRGRGGGGEMGGSWGEEERWGGGGKEEGRREGGGAFVGIMEVLPWGEFHFVTA